MAEMSLGTRPLGRLWWHRTSIRGPFHMNNMYCPSSMYDSLTDDLGLKAIELYTYSTPIYRAVSNSQPNVCPLRAVFYSYWSWAIADCHHCSVCQPLGTQTSWAAQGISDEIGLRGASDLDKISMSDLTWHRTTELSKLHNNMPWALLSVFCTNWSCDLRCSWANSRRAPLGLGSQAVQAAARVRTSHSCKWLALFHSHFTMVLLCISVARCWKPARKHFWRCPVHPAQGPLYEDRSCSRCHSATSVEHCLEAKAAAWLGPAMVSVCVGCPPISCFRTHAQRPTKAKETSMAYVIIQQRSPKHIKYHAREIVSDSL